MMEKVYTVTESRDNGQECGNKTTLFKEKEGAKSFFDRVSEYQKEQFPRHVVDRMGAWYYAEFFEDEREEYHIINLDVKLL